MDTSRIKAYAPVARREFIQSVTSKANILGLSENNTLTAEVKGDVAIIGGRPYLKKVEDLRQRIIQRISREGFKNVMESVAYTWFNRFMALRFMELHDYLDHGYRVMSNRSDSDFPEILERAGDIDLPGLDKEKAIELRLAGNKDNELYQMLIVAQCNALHRAMPFLFEPIDDETELLMPENLLHSSSPVRKMVSEIDEEDWREVEIIGWIYQFYISEKKDELMKAKKPYKTEEIPAVTQLFTPNWIVKYLVQNSLGRTWVATYPSSQLKQKMEYYIEPAEQEPEVQKQLEEITPKELDPEQLTVLDPACGSGHILVEAYNVFKEIYLERGYRTKDIPRIILEKNLYGLEIDDRAAQLSGFALLMKARADDRSILTDSPKMNILSIQGSEGMDAGKIADALISNKSRPLIEDSDLFPETKTQQVLTKREASEVTKQDIIDLIELFKLGKTVGSLIQVPPEMEQALPKIEQLINLSVEKGDTYSRAAAVTIEPFLKQAKLLSKKYDCVVANPPYMGKGYFNTNIKEFTTNNFPNSKWDLFSMFIDRGFLLAKQTGFNSMITMQSWMFLSSFLYMRKIILTDKTIITMAHLGSRAFSSISGEVVQTSAFIIWNVFVDKYKPSFFRLINDDEEMKRISLLERRNIYTEIDNNDFKKIPGFPIAYWASKKFSELFLSKKIDDVLVTRVGLATGDTEHFVRLWHEINISELGFGFNSRESAKESNKIWFPFNKGGYYRKWYGNNDYIVNWENDGEDIKERKASDLEKGLITPNNSKCWNQKYYFKRSINWTKVASTNFSARISEDGFIFSDASNGAFSENTPLEFYLGLLNSVISRCILNILSPTLNFISTDIAKIPVKFEDNITIADNVDNLSTLSKSDWDSYETSWDFGRFPWISAPLRGSTLEETFNYWKDHSIEQTKKMKELEEGNNRILIEAYGLQDELTPEVPEEQITLTVNPKYRYGGDYTEEELWQRFREDSIKELISYSIGCMMGRYSLDEPGLIYANSGSEGFDPSKYKSFHADQDGIIPVMDSDWFLDDATKRFVEFIKTVWPQDTIEDNLKFVAESLGRKRDESPVDTIRRYISNDFFKDHLKTYKKRPIYWLFSSGKNKAFECLVYLHRYNEATLARMRAEYVTPLQGKFSSRSEYLKNEIEQAGSTSSKKKLEREQSEIKKKQEELRKFDEELRHYADMRVKLELDDGVKVNYGKFGSLLAETKSVTGE